MCATINRAEAGPVRLVLVTGHAFGVRAFEGLFASSAFLDGKITVSLLIGLDDSRAAATVGYQPLSRLAAEQGVPYTGTFDGRLSSLAGRIRDIGPAYLLVIGWSYLMGADILSIPAAGSIGMHPSPLPLGRGQAPIPWTIIKGLKRTALSVFFLDEAADAGPVIARYDLDVRDNETSASLFYRVGHVHFTAGLDLAERIGGGAVTAEVQDEAAATRWPRRRPADGEIRDTMTAAEIEALVRALLGPYPRAFAWVDGERVAVRGVERTQPPALAAGYSARPDPGARRIPFRCGDGLVYLVRDDTAGLATLPGIERATGHLG